MDKLVDGQCDDWCASRIDVCWIFRLSRWCVFASWCLADAIARCICCYCQLWVRYIHITLKVEQLNGWNASTTIASTCCLNWIIYTVHYTLVTADAENYFWWCCCWARRRLCLLLLGCYLYTAITLAVTLPMLLPLLSYCDWFFVGIENWSILKKKFSGRIPMTIGIAI